MGTVLAPENDAIKTATLLKYSFFRDAGYALRQDILSHSHTADLLPGTCFFERGSPINQLALPGTGSVRVYIVGECGREVTLYHVQPGQSCPINMISILLNKNAPAIAIVESFLQAVVIDADYFRFCISEHAIIRQYVFETFASRMIDVFSLLEDIKFRKLDARLAEYLVKLLSGSEKSLPVIRVTHERLASELGSAREVISRLLRDFERMGILELARGQIFINNKQGLLDIINPPMPDLPDGDLSSSLQPDHTTRKGAMLSE